MNTERKQAIYTNSGFTLYDNTFTAMQMGMVDNNGFVKIAAINSEFVNKKPKKGDRVYDYDNSITYHLNAKDASVILKMINDLESDSENNKTVEYSTGEESNIYRSFKIAAPNAISLAKVTYPNYIIRFVKEDVGTENSKSTTYHIFEKTEYHLNKDTVEVHTGLEIFKKFLEGIILNSTNTVFHGAKKANNSNSGRNQRKTFSSNVVEEEDENSSESSSTASSLNDEFAD